MVRGHAYIDRQLEQDIINRITAAYDVQKIIVFGSRARGDYREDSDIDIFVVAPGAYGTDRSEIAVKIGSSLYGIPISKDLFVEDAQTFDNAAEIFGSPEYMIEREGVIIYERN